MNTLGKASGFSGIKGPSVECFPVAISWPLSDTIVSFFLLILGPTYGT